MNRETTSYKRGPDRLSEVSIEFFENIPQPVSIINRYKAEDLKLSQKLTSSKSKKGQNFVNINLNVSENKSQRHLLGFEAIKSEENLDRKAYGSSHHFNKVQRGLEFNSIESHYAIQDQQERRPAFHFNNAHTSILTASDQYKHEPRRKTITQQNGIRSKNLQVKREPLTTFPYDSKYETSTISHQTQAILDSQTNTWTHLPPQFFESRTEGSQGDLQTISQTVNKKKSNADLTIVQINRTLDQIEQAPLTNFEEAISALKKLQQGFQRMPRVESFIKNLAEVFVREEKRLNVKIEVYKTQTEVQILEYERQVKEARVETEQAKNQLVDEENFRLELMSEEKREQFHQMFRDWQSLSSLSDINRNFLEDQSFSNVTDPLKILFKIQNFEQNSSKVTNQGEELNLQSIIDRQNLNLKFIQKDQAETMSNLQRQTAINVLRRFYRRVVPINMETQTESDLIQVMVEEYEEKLNNQRILFNKAQIIYLDLKKEHESLQGQFGNAMREKREKMMAISKLEQQLLESIERANLLQIEVSSEEQRQQTRISKIEDQGRQIVKLHNEVANQLAFAQELENQIRAKKMQIQHMYQESSEATEKNEQMGQEIETLKTQLQETKHKLQMALSKTQSDAQNISKVNDQKELLARETSHNGKDYAHLLTKNILNDEEFNKFLASIKLDHKIEFEAEVLQAAQRRIELWFKNDSAGADPSVIQQHESLNRKIASSFQEKQRHLQRRGGVMYKQGIEIKKNSRQESSSSNSSSHQKKSKSQQPQVKLTSIKHEVITAPSGQLNALKKEKSQAQEFDVKVATKPQQLFEPEVAQVKTQLQKIVNNKSKDELRIRTKSVNTSTVDEVPKQLVATPQQKNQQITRKQPIQTQKLQLQQIGQQDAANNGTQSQNRILARPAPRIAVNGKCQQCLEQLSEEDKNKVADSYQLLLKLQVILSEKARNSTINTQLLNEVMLRVKDLEAGIPSREQLHVQFGGKPRKKSLPKYQQFDQISKSISPQRSQESQMSSVAHRMQPSISKRPNHFQSQILSDIQDPLLGLDMNMLITTSELKVPQVKLIDSFTQTDVTVYDRENLLALQAYLGKRIVYARADVYTNLKSKMRHPDVPFVGQRVKLEPVLGPRSSMLNKSEAQNQ